MSYPEQAVTPERVQQVWAERIRQAREARRPYEPVWLSNAAFRAGQHWLVWDPSGKRMRNLQDMDPRYRDRDLYTADRINEYVQAQLGELGSGDDRPDLVTVQSGDTAEDVAAGLNGACEHGWDNEWNAQSALDRARSFCLTYGTSAIRVRRDPGQGQVVGHHPVDRQGQPIQDQQAVAYLTENGVLPDGSLPRFKPVREGRTVWEPYTAFQLLPQPGVTHEDDLGWEVLVRPVPLEDVQALYPDTSATLVADGDIASASGLTTSQQDRGTGQKPGRLRDHVWLYTGFRRPCPNYPDGQTVVLGSNQHVLLDVQQQLDYQKPDGTPHSGVVYLHWWRQDDRFFSRGFIEPMKDPQRAINEMKTVSIEIVRRGLPKVFTEQGALVHNPQGLPLENIELKQGASKPDFFAGIGPGPWMEQMTNDAIEDLSHASTLSPLRLGENPTNVDTYSQLALLNENESVKRSVILGQHQQAVGNALVCSVNDIQRYWPDQKRLRVSGPDGSIQEQAFSKSSIPVFFQVKVETGAPTPRSEAAELKKVDAIWAAATECGLTVRDPDRWTRWYRQSLDAKEALPLPEVEQDSQQQMAEFENFMMVDQQQEVAAADYDLPAVHIPVHREAQDQARAAGDLEAFQRLQRHIDQSVAVQQANAARVAAMQQTPSPLAAPAAGAPQPQFVNQDFQRLAAGN